MYRSMDLPPGSGSPAAEYVIDEALARRLLRAQHGDLADLPLGLLGEGFDNVMYRLGASHVVRLPRRRSAAGLIRHEQQWLPDIAPTLPLPVPVPVRIGRPERGGSNPYPWYWSVLPWFDGVTAERDWPGIDQADRFADFLVALHRPASAAMPRNPVRGVPLARRRESVEARRAGLPAGLWNERIDAIWRQALAAKPGSHEVLLHGDLHPRNILVRDGRLRAVCDFGDICAGDPATDLGGIWLLLRQAAARRRVMARYGQAQPWVRDDPGLWQRARGWAVAFATLLVETGSVDHAAHALIGRCGFDNLLGDEG